MAKTDGCCKTVKQLMGEISGNLKTMHRQIEDLQVKRSCDEKCQQHVDAAVDAVISSMERVAACRKRPTGPSCSRAFRDFRKAENELISGIYRALRAQGGL